MTTIVASPPTYQSLPRINWNASPAGQAGYMDISNEDVSRMFAPQRKLVTRSSSSSSLNSDVSSTSTSTLTSTTDSSQFSHADQPVLLKKKSRGGFWPVTKAESTASLTHTKANGAVQSANNAIAVSKNAVAPTTPDLNTTAPNGIRALPPTQSPALLVLLPMNGTFERKQISVPIAPDPPQKIGRQTNAKTIPRPDNGYFDSKVLSRSHAEIWADQQGRVWIKDIKSSNGTFVDGNRLSPENKESEPTELKQGTTLELGIDIVSEDQKTIVHHKVSAKVEFAGFPGKSSNILDMNFGDLDPSQPHNLLNSPMGAPMLHPRTQQGRPINGRAASVTSSAVGSGVSGLAQRQMSYWAAPLNIEQLVKQVGVEMRAAKQQAYDLEQANKHLSHLIPSESSTSHISPTSGVRKPKPPRTSHAHFTEPPAPPPSQPLPEKPDGGIKSASPSKREMTTNGVTTSPTSTQSSQILQLIEALESAKKEMASQAAKVKELEAILKQERTAREAAEEKAKRLEELSSARPTTIIESQSIPKMNTKGGDGDVSIPRVDNKTSESALQEQFDSLLSQMAQMQSTLHATTSRAETAEKQCSTLAEMIEKYRRENHEETSIPDPDVPDIEAPSSSMFDGFEDDEDVSPMRSATVRAAAKSQGNGHVKSPSMSTNLEQAVASVLSQTQNGQSIPVQSAPYISMLGVVLIGVGVMAYLNSYKKGET